MIEISDVLRRYLGRYCRHHKLSDFQQKVIKAILQCRTADMGVYIEGCDNCDYTREQFRSCRNRHCPKCQGSNRNKWVSARLTELLPIPYYHLVFTMPHSLNWLALYNKRVIYDMFFKAASYTINTFARDKKYLGGQPGYIGILHSWGQTLSYHIHLHFIITGGGITGSEWRNLPYKKDFIFPVKAMSLVMRQKFSQLLQQAYDGQELIFANKMKHLAKPWAFRAFLKKVAWENWFIYAKKPFAGPEQVVKYIGRYTHRIAISNRRLVSIDDGKVTFSYKHYKSGTVRELPLASERFIQRFLWHILPKGFKRIRHFGFLSTACRTGKLKLVRDLFKITIEKMDNIAEHFADLLEHITLCPECKTGRLRLVEAVGLHRLVPG